MFLVYNDLLVSFANANTVIPYANAPLNFRLHNYHALSMGPHKRARLDQDAADLGAAIQKKRLSAPRAPGATSVRHRVNAVAGPSNLRKPSVLEEQLLEALRRGDGISAFEQDNFLEQCCICEYYFLATLLRRHLPECAACH